MTDKLVSNTTAGKAKASTKLGRQKAESKSGIARRREKKSTDRNPHKTMLSAVHQAALEATRPILDQVEALRQESAKKDAEIETLMRRLARVEAGQKAQESRGHVPQSLAELKPRRTVPAGMTAMQSIMGQLDVEETTEELLAQLKALD